jgi:hypothetical protein
MDYYDIVGLFSLPNENLSNMYQFTPRRNLNSEFLVCEEARHLHLHPQPSKSYAQRNTKFSFNFINFCFSK